MDTDDIPHDFDIPTRVDWLAERWFVFGLLLSVLIAYLAQWAGMRHAGVIILVGIPTSTAHALWRSSRR